MRKRTIDLNKDGRAAIVQALEDEKTILRSVSMTFEDQKSEKVPVSDKGWGIPLLDCLWKRALHTNADRICFSMGEAKTALLWSCEIMLTAPDRNKGWRKYTDRLGLWLRSLVVILALSSCEVGPPERREAIHVNICDGTVFVDEVRGFCFVQPTGFAALMAIDCRIARGCTR